MAAAAGLNLDPLDLPAGSDSAAPAAAAASAHSKNGAAAAGSPVAVKAAAAAGSPAATKTAQPVEYGVGDQKVSPSVKHGAGHCAACSAGCTGLLGGVHCWDVAAG